jgi:hypothetical protein
MPTIPGVALRFDMLLALRLALDERGHLGPMSRGRSVCHLIRSYPAAVCAAGVPTGRVVFVGKRGCQFIHSTLAHCLAPSFTSHKPSQSDRRPVGDFLYLSTCERGRHHTSACRRLRRNRNCDIFSALVMLHLDLEKLATIFSSLIAPLVPRASSFTGPRKSIPEAVNSQSFHEPPTRSAETVKHRACRAFLCSSAASGPTRGQDRRLRGFRVFLSYT